MSDLPGVDQTVLDGQLGVVANSGGAVPAIIGCSSTGDYNRPIKYAGGQQDSLIADFGHGPLVQMASLILARGKSCVVVRAKQTTDGAVGTPVISSPGTSVITVTGSALDTYTVRVEFLKGGTIGTAGIEFRYSLDDGRTWGSRQRLGTAALFELPNTGITLNFDPTILVGEDEVPTTVLATTRVRVATTEPKWGSSDISEAFAALGATLTRWDYVQVVGACSAGEASAIKAELTTLETKKKPRGALLEAVRQTSNQTEQDWIEGLATAFQSFDSRRILIGAGEALVFSPVDKNTYMRPATWPAAVRAATVDDARYELGYVKDAGFGGPLDCAITDEPGNPIAHNEYITPGLDAARFMTLCTYPEKGNRVYVTRANLMSPEGSDFYSWRLRRLMDVACETTSGVLIDEVSSTPATNPDGTILEGEALNIESQINSALRDAVLDNGRATAAYATVNRTDNLMSTRKVRVKTRVRPRATVYWIEEEIAYEGSAQAGGA